LAYRFDIFASDGGLGRHDRCWRRGFVHIASYSTSKRNRTVCRSYEGLAHISRVAATAQIVDSTPYNAQRALSQQSWRNQKLEKHSFGHNTARDRPRRALRVCSNDRLHIACDCTIETSLSAPMLCWITAILLCLTSV
jgi:hypothetical protein